MKAFKEFRREDKSFWFFIRFISDKQSNFLIIFS